MFSRTSAGLGLFTLIAVASFHVPGAAAQGLTGEQRQLIDTAVPARASATPKRPRRLLVVNLQMRSGAPVQGPSYAALAAQNYALEQMGKRTGAYEVVITNDIEMFRPGKIDQFDAICFCNSLGVLTDDAVLRKSLMDFVAGGKGIVGIHDGLATFVQWPRYDQFSEFGQMLGGTENGGHPWDGEMSIKVDDPASPLVSMFGRDAFLVKDQAFQLQEPNLRDRLRVLLSIDVGKMAPKSAIFSNTYRGQRLPDVVDQDARQRTRILYGLWSLGLHVLESEAAEHFLAGIQYALGDLQSDDRPSAPAAR